MKCALIPILITFFSFQLAASEFTLIAPGSNWNYLDDGSDQGTAWKEAGFDDSMWAIGAAQLGFGDGDENTVINGEGTSQVTTYFRHYFTVTDTNAFDHLNLELLRDDGAVVFINGTEVTRSNMPAGNINYLTLAPLNIVGDAEDAFNLETLPVSVLQIGTNVIAVEIHQRGTTSSDASFDLSLKAFINDALISSGASWKYLDDGSDQGTAWQEVSYDDFGWSLGASELGYGDGNEATVVSFGPNILDKYITTYFRKSIEINNYADILGFNLRLLRDDGAVVYVNGTEVKRSNMPGGTITNTTEASSNVILTAESVFEEVALNPAFFSPGTNLVAVEVHQSSPTSADLSFDLELSSTIVPNLIRGPYLQTATPVSITVKWRTDQAAPAKVWYGSHPDSLTSVVTVNTVAYNHEVTLNGLTPNTTYFYAIGSGDIELAGGNTQHHFKTHPLPGETQPMRIWVVGDSGEGNNNGREVRDAYYNYVGNEHTDAMLMLGDNAYDNGTDAEYQVAVFENMYEDLLKKTPLWPCPGNHDYQSGADGPTQSGPYYDIFTLPKNGESGGLPSGTEAYYSFDIGNVHFISMDSHDTNRSTDGPMLTWLENDLAATTQEWIVAYWHHPPYSRGSHNSDIELRLIEMRANALPILENYGVDLVLCGHSHSYERSYLINGHYSFSFLPEPDIIVNGNSGSLDIDCLYQKSPNAPDPDRGAVYIVAGSSSKISGGNLNHPIMYSSLNQLGSVILEFDNQQLNAKFINNAGLISDQFTIVKRMITADTGSGEIAADTVAFVPGQSIQLQAAEGFLNYLWTKDGSTISGENTAALTITEAGAYTVLATNVGGCAVIDSVFVIETPGIAVQANVLLQGAYDSNTSLMTTDLRDAALIPLEQPFNRPPWNYPGNENVSTASDLPANLTDWVLFEVRDANDNDQILEQKAAFLLNNGELADVLSATNPSLEGVLFYQLQAGENYFLSVKTRNHIAVLSATTVALPNAMGYDFTVPVNVEGGTTQLGDLGNGNFGLFSGDFDANGIITIADFNLFNTQASLLNIYVNGDGNLDKTVSTLDFNLYNANASKIGVSQIRY